MRKILTGLVLVSFLLSSCGKKEKKEVYPFSSGDNLTYRATRKDNRGFPGTKTFIVYKITVLENGNFKVVSGSKLVGSSGEIINEMYSFERVYSPYGNLIAISRQGKKQDAGKNKNRLCSLYLPERFRKKGVEVEMENLFRPMKVVGKTTWENRSVWEVKIGKLSRFYDEKTGILYGTYDGFQKKLLVDKKISKL